MRRLSWVLWPFRKAVTATRWAFKAVVAALVWVLLIPWRILKGIVAILKMLWRGVVATPHMLWMATCAIGRFTIALPRNVWLGLRAIPRLTWQGIRRLVHWLLVPPRLLWRGIVAVARMIGRSPRKTYESLRHARDWLLAKVEYLQSESAKWRTLFNIAKSPYTLLRAMGLSPQMAATFLFAGSAVTSGVVVNEVVLSERSFARGDSGVYAASVLGPDLPLDVPTEYVEGSNTLRIDLGSTPVREITIENVSVGTVFTGSALPSGEQNVVQISGNVIGGGTNTRLEIGHLIFEKSRCKKLELSDIQAHTIIIKGNASDGQSIAPSPGTSRMRAIGGGHQQADAMVTSGGTYDRIWIQAPNNAVNGKVDTMRLTNLFTKGGICHFSKLTLGTLEILRNEIGEGNGFATKEFTVATTVTGANITIEDNVEVTIAEPATQ